MLGVTMSSIREPGGLHFMRAAGSPKESRLAGAVKASIRVSIACRSVLTRMAQAGDHTFIAVLAYKAPRTNTAVVRAMVHTHATILTLSGLTAVYIYLTEISSKARGAQAGRVWGRSMGVSAGSTILARRAIGVAGSSLHMAISPCISLCTDTDVATIASLYTCRVVRTGLCSTRVNIYVTVTSHPPRVTDALPWCSAGAMETARERSTLLTPRALPARFTSAFTSLLTESVHGAAIRTTFSTIGEPGCETEQKTGGDQRAGATETHPDSQASTA